jgi:hypothetical protein
MAAAIATSCPHDVAGEKRKNRKRPQNPHQPRDHRSHRSRLGDHEPGPGIKKSRERPIPIADIHILPARLRLHRAQFRISERPKKRKRPTHHPSQIHKLSRPHRLHHLRRNQKNPAPNNGPHHNGGSVAHPQIAREFRTASCVVCELWHVRSVPVYVRTAEEVPPPPCHPESL